MMIPELIRHTILDYCRRNAGARIDIHKEGNPYPWYGLSFDIDGKAKVLESNLTIIEYISNHMEYSRIPIAIKVNGLDLKEIVPLALPILPPEQINTDL